MIPFRVCGRRECRDGRWELFLVEDGLEDPGADLALPLADEGVFWAALRGPTCEAVRGIRVLWLGREWELIAAWVEYVAECVCVIVGPIDVAV